MPKDLYTEVHIPEKVRRNEFTAKVRKRRICTDERVYNPIQFTIPGPLSVGEFEPMWPVDKDYWVANVTAEVGLHDTGTHPVDGTPGGAAIHCNFRIRNYNLSTDTKLLKQHDRINIASGQHQDSVTRLAEAAVTRNSFNFTKLSQGQHVYAVITQVGSTRPGGTLVMTLYLVPRRHFVA